VSLTETQEFLKVQYTMKYDQRHPEADGSENQMINSYIRKYCPYCGSEKIHQERAGCNRHTKVQMHLWKNFKPTTGTKFESRKIPVSEWILQPIPQIEGII